MVLLAGQNFESHHHWAGQMADQGLCPLENVLLVLRTGHVLKTMKSSGWGWLVTIRYSAVAAGGRAWARLAWRQGVGPVDNTCTLKPTEAPGTRKSGTWRLPDPGPVPAGEEPPARLEGCNVQTPERHQTDQAATRSERNCLIIACGTQEMPWVKSEHAAAHRG